MKNTMSRAHEIRREAAAKWNCNVSEIVFSFCLEMAWRESSMKNHKEVVSWELSDGRAATVTIELITGKDIWLDGHESTMSVCEKHLYAELDGEDVGYHIQEVKNHAQCSARIGKLGLTFKMHRLIKDAIRKIESTDEWQAKVKREADNAAAAKKDYERKKANGYCFKCGSYCFGDCSI